MGGPTEQEVIERRAAAYAEAEEARRALLQAEEERQWSLVEALAQEASARARVEFRWGVVDFCLISLPSNAICTLFR